MGCTHTSFFSTPHVPFSKLVCGDLSCTRYNNRDNNRDTHNENDKFCSNKSLASPRRDLFKCVPRAHCLGTLDRARVVPVQRRPTSVTRHVVAIHATTFHPGVTPPPSFSFSDGGKKRHGRGRMLAVTRLSCRLNCDPYDTVWQGYCKRSCGPFAHARVLPHHPKRSILSFCRGSVRATDGAPHPSLILVTCAIPRVAPSRIGTLECLLSDGLSLGHFCFESRTVSCGHGGGSWKRQDRLQVQSVTSSSTYGVSLCNV